MEHQLSQGAKSLADYQYTHYDGLGRLTAMSGQDQVFSSIAKDYVYDGRGQLTQANVSLNPKSANAPSIHSSFDYSYNASSDMIVNEGRPMIEAHKDNGELLSLKPTHSWITFYIA